MTTRIETTDVLGKANSSPRLQEQLKKAGRDVAKTSRAVAGFCLGIMIMAVVSGGCQRPPAAKDKTRKIQNAAARGDIRTLRSCLDQEPNLAGVQNQDGATLLHIASENGRNEVIKLLLEGNADANAVRAGGVVPLHLTVFANNLVGTMLLLDAGADIHRRDTAGWNALYIAAAMDYQEMLKCLLSRGGAMDVFVSAGMGDLPGVKKALAQNRSLLQPRPDSGFSLLHIAATGGRKDVVAFLINAGSQIDAKTREGTPLTLATMMGHQQVAGLLIRNGADVNASDRNGYAPLHFAASEGHLGLAELLVAHGARIDAQTKDGKTPLDLAKTKQHEKLIDFLTRKEAGPK